MCHAVTGVTHPRIGFSWCYRIVKDQHERRHRRPRGQIYATTNGRWSGRPTRPPVLIRYRELMRGSRESREFFATNQNNPGDDLLSRFTHYHGPRMLNGRVRNGNGCGHSGMLTGKSPGSCQSSVGQFSVRTEGLLSSLTTSSLTT